MAAVPKSLELTETVSNPPSTITSRRRRRHLSADEYAAFRELCAEYLSLDHSAEHANAHRLANAIIQKDLQGHRLIRSDIDTLETALIRLQPLARVRERLLAMSREHARLAGVRESLITSEKADEQTVRARAEELLAELHTASLALRLKQKLCGKLLVTFLLSTTLVIGGLTALGLACSDLAGLWPGSGASRLTFWSQLAWGLDTLPPMFSMMMAGAIGAFISGLIRLQKMTAAPRLAMQVSAAPSLLSAMIAPLIGAFAAWFVFSCFAGQLLQGNILPVIDWKRGNDAYPVFGSILAAWPHDMTSNAKMLLAGLASGFSERLFPDLLNRIGRELEPGQPASAKEV